MRRVVVAAITLIAVAFMSNAAPAGPHDHHHGDGACRPTPAERHEAAEFARVTIKHAEKFATPAHSMADGYVPFIDFWRPVGHYFSPQRYSDGVFLDPKRPEALVYANTWTGPKLLGILYSMEDEGRPYPDLGGCIVTWHTHPMCRNAAGVRHIWEGNCPPGESYDGESEWMLHVWTVPMKGNPYQAHADDHWYCWPRLSC